MAFTKQHFEAIAASVRRTRTAISTSSDYSSEAERAAALDALDHLVDEFSALLATKHGRAQNDRSSRGTFNRGRFLDDCGVERGARHRRAGAEPPAAAGGAPDATPGQLRAAV